MSWTAQRERGSVAMLRIAFWIVRVAGWHAGQALLYPITLYFYVASPGLRAVSRDYLRRVLPGQVSRYDVMRHIFTFACVLLDRVFFLSGRADAYTLETAGVEALTSLLEEGRGCVLLGAHVGSFDMLRAFGRLSPVPVSPVMSRQESGVFTKLVENIDPDLARCVIDIGAPGAMLKVQERIQRGEIVAFLGDRTPGPHRTVDLQFLGGTAAFPAGPMVMAAVTTAPVVLFYGVRTGPRRYAVQFETFADRIQLRRASRAEDLRGWLQIYANSVAQICKAHPFNWFNFYDFWQPSPDGGAHA